MTKLKKIMTFSFTAAVELSQTKEIRNVTLHFCTLRNVIVSECTFYGIRT